jgi:thiamine transporter
MRNERIRIIAEVGLSIALFAVLDFFNVRLPINIAGGSIALVMLPIVVIALLRGPWVGLLTGFLCGLVDLAIQPYALNIVQVLLDYPIAYALVGLAGILTPVVKGQVQRDKALIAAALAFIAAFVGAAGRFIAAVLSGVIFFASNAPAGQNAWLYSTVYNLSYLVPSAIAVGVGAAVIVPLLARIFAHDENAL